MNALSTLSRILLWVAILNVGALLLNNISPTHIKVMNANLTAISFLAAVLISLSASAQRVYVTHKRSEADKLFYQTKVFSDAHYVVARTYDYDLPEKNHWFFVTSKQAADSGWVIYYVKKPQEAEYYVMFTTNKKLLGQYTGIKK
jgi:hypothetical protein